MYSSTYPAEQPERSSRMYYLHNPAQPPTSNGAENYYSHSTDVHRYGHANHGIQPHQIYPPPDHVVPSQVSASPSAIGLTGMYPFGGVGAPQQTQNYQIMFTDDASTKLSDRVRRKCFNCSTTDTSTWRRSSLNPGKVVCFRFNLLDHPYLMHL